MIKVRVLSKEGTKVIRMTRSRAIRERCINCSGWSPIEASNCKEEICPLYPFRTGRGTRGKSKERNKAMLRYCHWCLQRKSLKECSSPLCPLYVYRLGTPDESVIVERIKQPFMGFSK